MQIVTTVDKEQVSKAYSTMVSHLRIAKSIRPESTFVQIREAQAHLYKANGMFQVLENLDLLEKPEITSEEIDHIAQKIDGILAEKRRNDKFQWKGGIT